MSATVKFYTALAIVLAIVISVSFAAGYRAGFAHAVKTQVAAHATHPRAQTP